MKGRLEQRAASEEWSKPSHDDHRKSVCVCTQRKHGGLGSHLMVQWELTVMLRLCWSRLWNRSLHTGKVYNTHAIAIAHVKGPGCDTLQL